MLILAIIVGKYPIRSANYEIRGISSLRWFSEDAELAEYEIHPHGRIRANDIILALASMMCVLFRSCISHEFVGIRTDLVQIAGANPEGERGRSTTWYGPGNPMCV